MSFDEPLHNIRVLPISESRLGELGRESTDGLIRVKKQKPRKPARRKSQKSVETTQKSRKQNDLLSELADGAVTQVANKALEGAIDAVGNLIAAVGGAVDI
jgi:hypothetical protein